MPDSMVAERAVEATEQLRSPVRRRHPGSVIATVLLALVILGGIIAALAFAMRGDGRRATPPGEADRLSAVQAASSAVVAFTSYDAATVKQDFANVQKLATGEFAKQYAAAAPDLQKLIVAGKASSKGSVVSAAAVSVDAQHAVVLLAVDDAVKNSQLPKGAVRNYRFRVTLDRADGRWLISALSPVA